MDDAMATSDRSKPSNPPQAAKVSVVQDLSPRVRCIRLKGPDIVGLEWSAGQKVKVRANGALRSYTPARVDSAQGWMDIVFFLHGNGPLSQWAAEASVGDEVHFEGPAKSMPGLQETPDWAIFLGDETTIGLAKAMIDALPKSVIAMGAVELDEEDVTAIEAFDLPLSPAIRRGQHGDPLIQWLEQADIPEGNGMVWLSGEAITVIALRQALNKRTSVHAQIKVKAYWSVKGHAHRKALGV